uniref:Cysteine-rich with EGF-like domain protein 2 n=1 Tax=Strongyloides venezuelensis TaxID=75913 RepID=A0A0K0FBK9_STRVS
MENVHGDCTACKLLVDTFLVGLEKTKKGNFAGGNTDWEEKKLGTYKKSETRFLEIIEFVCKKDSLDDKDTYSHISNIEFKCHTLLENHEEEIEEWFKNDQDKHSDMKEYFCYDKFKLCCPSGYYSSECKPCPGLLSNGKVCYGRGTCNGDGLRKGTGKCSCDEGYAGPYCNNCASQYFENIKTDSYIECEKCYEGCAKGCKSSGPKGCTACRTGFEMNEELGCIDIDECLDGEKKCTKANQICKNNIGSYNCLCADGYILNGKTNECEVDINGAVIGKEDTDKEEVDEGSSTQELPTKEDL